MCRRLAVRVPAKTEDRRVPHAQARWVTLWEVRFVRGPSWLWVAALGLVALLLTVDYVIAYHRRGPVGLREATVWSVFYIVVALLFGLGVWAVVGGAAAVEVLRRLGRGEEPVAGQPVRVRHHHEQLRGAARTPAEGASVRGHGSAGAAWRDRSIFGAAAISLFSPTFLLFGLLLLWTSFQLARHRNKDPNIDDNPILRLTRRVLPVTNSFHDGQMVARVDGARMVTPLFLVFVAIGSTDLLFALDSIPAVFGISQHAFIVFTANAFALLGLRALYFLVEGLLERLVYLSIGLAAILAFIGVKLILLFLHEDVSASVPEVPTPLSLLVVFAILLVTTIASVIRVRTHPEERAHAGTIRILPLRMEDTPTEERRDRGANHR